MPKVLLSTITGISNALGDVVYYMIGSKCYFRRKGSGPSGDQTPEQVAQTNIMSTLGRLSSMFDPITKIGLKIGKFKGPTGVYNNFVYYNRKNAIWDADKKEVVVNFSDLVLSRGLLYPPDVTAAVDKESSSVLFDQESAFEGAKMDLTDDLFGCIFDMKNEFCTVVPLKKRSESGSTIKSLPAQWDLDSLVIYTFARDAKKKHCSKTKVIYGL